MGRFVLRYDIVNEIYEVMEDGLYGLKTLKVYTRSEGPKALAHKELLEKNGERYRFIKSLDDL